MITTAPSGLHSTCYNSTQLHVPFFIWQLMIWWLEVLSHIIGLLPIPSVPKMQKKNYHSLDSSP